MEDYREHLDQHEWQCSVSVQQSIGMWGKKLWRVSLPAIEQSMVSCLDEEYLTSIPISCNTG